MKIGVVLLLALLQLSSSSRPKRAGVLTDESKKVLDHFDFSSFDKQEALNYLDRQRYDNQIRGKRTAGLTKYHGSPAKRRNAFRRRKMLEIKDLLAQLEKKIKNIKEVESDSDPVIFSNGFIEKSAIRRKRDDKAKKKHISGKRDKTHQEVKEKSTSNGANHKDSALQKKNKTAKKETEKNKEKKVKDSKKETSRKVESKVQNAEEKEHTPYWGEWSEWSECSVTCGKGREIRSRRCIAADCSVGEIEMGEKTCQLPACNLLSKFFKILK